MEIQKRKDQKQGGTLAGADLSGAINSQKEISGYYDQMATDMMRVADAGVTHFTNSMIEDAKVEGEVAGKEGSKKGSRTATKEDAGDGTKVDANGQPIKEGKAMATAPGGYERQNQIFKWNRTFNNSAQKTFQTNTTAQASGYAKQVAKQVNGNMGAYKTVMNETKSQAMAGTTDPRQRAHIESAYDSAFAKNMGTVTTTGIKIQTKLAEQTWKFGRQEFQDNLAIKQNIITQASADMYNPDLDEKTQREAGEKLKTAQAEYEKMVVKRLEDSAPGINLGAYTYEQVKFDTREDMRDSHITSEIYTLTQMDKKKEGGLYTYKDNPNLNAHENKEARDAVYEHIASVNSAEIVQESRETRHINQEKRVVKTKIKTAVLNVNDDEFLDSMGITDDQVADGKSQVMTQIQNAYKSNLINKAERDTYIDELLNGTEVTKDNMQTYSSINSNIEDFTAEMIVGRTDLTDATLKELLKKREKWETEGEEWMKLPDYSEGKTINLISTWRCRQRLKSIAHRSEEAVLKVKEISLLVSLRESWMIRIKMPAHPSIRTVKRFVPYRRIK